MRCRCVECAAGSQTELRFDRTTDELYVHVETGATSCRQCGVGKYRSVGMPYCQDCAGGSQTTAQTPIVPDTDYLAVGATGCVKCVTGLYRPATESEPTEDTESCQTCPRGSMTVMTDPAPALLKPESFRSEGATACVACGPGYYQDVADGTACKDCWAPGSHTVDGDGNHATGALHGAVACENCPLGRFQDAARGLLGLECQNCALTGTQTSVSSIIGDQAEWSDAGATACTTCTKGKYLVEQLEAQSKAKCVASLWTHSTFVSTITFSGGTKPTCGGEEWGRTQQACEDSVGKCVVTECQPCASAGKETQTTSGDFVESGAVQCGSCAVGTYQPAPESNAINEDKCIVCVVGSQTEVDGVGDGIFMEVGASACVTCTIGQYSAHATGGADCGNCVVGSQTEDVGVGDGTFLK
jgi:hypothetical protein